MMSITLVMVKFYFAELLVQNYLPTDIWVKFLNGNTRSAYTMNFGIYLAAAVGICVYCLYCFMYSVYLNRFV